MNFVLWLIFGGLVGWGASLLMGSKGRQGILLNVVVGVVGALLGGWLLGGLFGFSTINQDDFSVSGLGISLLGAMVLLTMLRLVHGSATQ